MWLEIYLVNFFDLGLVRNFLGGIGLNGLNLVLGGIVFLR